MTAASYKVRLVKSLTACGYKQPKLATVSATLVVLTGYVVGWFDSMIGQCNMPACMRKIGKAACLKAVFTNSV